MSNKIIGLVVGFFLAAASLSVSVHAGTCNLSPECKGSYEAEIAYWKRQARGAQVVHHSRKVVNVTVHRRVVVVPSVNTCVVSTTHEPGFMSGFAYKNGAIIWETHRMVKGLRTTWCLPRNVWTVADKFWVCKKQSSKFPNGRGKILLPNDMADWRRVGRPLGVMEIKD
jgi:hypothetical protein